MQLNVIVDRVLYPPPTEKEADWFILATNQGVCKGKMPWRPCDMQMLVLDGEYATYRGERQFNFKSAMIDVPADPRAKLRYVCERTKGIGPIMENAIWAQCGENWTDIQPGQIPKMTDTVLQEFRVQIEALARDEQQVKVVTWLMSKGSTQAMAASAFAKWGKDTIGIVISNPYQLAELPHYGFAHVDKEIRKHFGIEDDDTRRIKACVIYSLRSLTDDGSTVVTWEDLFRQCCGMLGGKDDLITDCTSELFETGDLVGFKGSGCISLGGDYRNEKQIHDFVCEAANAV